MGARPQGVVRALNCSGGLCCLERRVVRRIRGSGGEMGMPQHAVLRARKAAASEPSKSTGLITSAAAEAAHFAVRNGVRCAGAHLIIDLYGATRLDDIEHIETTLRRCVEAASATLLHIHLHRFEPNGVSGVAVLAESHISIHTWPEAGYAALD